MPRLSVNKTDKIIRDKRMCIQCNTRSSYNMKGETKGLYCKTHKKDGMINVVEKRICIQDECNKLNPVYNVEGESKGIYCGKHKKDGMINVVSPICIENGCKKHPIYNMEGETKGIYCKTHKKDGMNDVLNPRCIHDGCNKICPPFNIEGQTKGIYCKTHKKDGMIDVLNPRCIENGCYIQPIYNFMDKKSGLYCLEHKKDGMINIVSKTCIHEGCNIQPHFNILGKKTGLYCGAHKLNGMVDVIHKHCIHDGCEIQPVYNMEGQKTGLYCDAHKLNGMIDIKSKRCKTHLCDTFVNNKYEGYCFRCFIDTFPDKPISRDYKTKEKNVVDNIKSSFPDFSWIEDRKISGGSSKRRPDLFLDMDYRFIDVEIDENRHSNYDPDSEHNRMMEISQDVGRRPIVFIRFNPDDYIDENGKKITSCWGLNKERIMSIKKCKEKEWTERINALKTQIQYCIDNPTDKTIEVVQLFY